MKKLFFVLAVVILASCQTSSRFYKTETYFTDFRPFAEKGFLMTTQPITDKYTSIGEVSFQCKAGYDPEKRKKAVTGDEMYYTPTAKIPPKQCDVNDVLNQIYIKAKELGANGIVQLRIEYNEETNKLHYFSDITVTGLAVKIGN